MAAGTADPTIFFFTNKGLCDTMYKSLKTTGALKMKEKKKGFKWWLIPVCVIGIPVVAFGIYIASVFIRYYRIDDNVSLGVTGSAKQEGNTPLSPII